MATSAISPGRRSNPALWAGLLVVAAGAWVLLIRQSPGMPASMAGPWFVFGEFLLLWVVMMAAMMLPSVAPVASMYLTVVRSRRSGPAAAHTAALVAGYLLAWAAFGVAGYALSRAIGRLAPMGMGMAPSRLAVWSAAIALAVAGLYQFTRSRRGAWRTAVRRSDSCCTSGTSRAGCGTSGSAPTTAVTASAAAGA